jgi:hypothetical protein
MEQEIETTQQEIIQQKSTIPPLPHWPTSKPGPMVTDPPPGTIRVPLRTEQVIETNYDQELGMPVVSRTDEQ